MENIELTEVAEEVAKTGMKGSTIATILVITSFAAGIIATKLLITPIADKVKAVVKERKDEKSEEFMDKEAE